MSDVIENQSPAADAAPVTISILDLANVVKVIDYAADQGAFRGWSVIEQVATLRQKINSFVEAAQAAQDAQSAAAAGGDAATAESASVEPEAAPAPASAKKVTKRSKAK